MDRLPKTGNTLAVVGASLALMAGHQALAGAASDVPQPPRGTDLDIRAPHLLGVGYPGILTIKTSGGPASKVLSLDLPEGIDFSAAYPKSRISGCEILKNAVRCKIKGGSQNVRVRVMPISAEDNHATFTATLKPKSPRAKWRISDEDTSGLIGNTPY